MRCMNVSTEVDFLAREQQKKIFTQITLIFSGSFIWIKWCWLLMSQTSFTFIVCYSQIAKSSGIWENGTKRILILMRCTKTHDIAQSYPEKKDIFIWRRICSFMITNQMCVVFCKKDCFFPSTYLRYSHIVNSRKFFLGSKRNAACWYFNYGGCCFIIVPNSNVLSNIAVTVIWSSSFMRFKCSHTFGGRICHTIQL